SETPDGLRQSGETKRILGWRGAARLFDSEKETRQSNPGRRENPDDERSALEPAGGGRVVLSPLADRAVFQGVEIDARFSPLPVPKVPECGELDGVGVDGVSVS